MYNSLCVRTKKTTNFGLWQMEHKLCAVGAAHVYSPVHTYVHLVHKLIANHTETVWFASVYQT